MPKSLVIHVRSNHPTPTSRTNSRKSGNDSPTTLWWSPSMEVTKAPPSPSTVKVMPALRNLLGGPQKAGNLVAHITHHGAQVDLYYGAPESTLTREDVEAAMVDYMAHASPVEA